MQRSIRWFTTVAPLLAGMLAMSCDSMTTLGGTGAPYNNGASSSTAGSAGDDGGAGGDDAASGRDGTGGCAYTDNTSYCACMGWTCGGATITDLSGANQTVYCGACSNAQYCQPDPVVGAGVGSCGGVNPLTYAWQKQKIDMLVSMGENDTTTVNYAFARNIGDGRGYTVGKVGFCTGTGDFIVVAACYNDLKPGNVLSKYWGHRDASGAAIDGLIYYNDQYVATGQNQGATALIDKFGKFVADVATAAGESDGIFRACQDSMADAAYLSAAAAHVDERKLSGALTIGFLYDTELNFGDEDDPGTGAGNATAGAKTVMARADVDYGAGLPTDFTGRPWEESKWLGYLIKERAIVMAGNSTWKTDIDQNATWEAARRLHTGTTNSPESATNLDMDYDLTSEYKAGTTTAGTPCWSTGLPSPLDSASSIYTVSTDKAASATDATKWVAKGTLSKGSYAACPANPSP